MSMSRYDSSGFSGQSYDRNVFEANLSTVNKLQRDYWNAKQVLRKKLGKEEDKHVVASDSELDSKLDLFRSVQTTCADLIKTIEKYQKCICVLSREENAMGQFLKEQGTLDKTAAGNMMIAVGKAQCYTSQQRLNLRHSLGRLLHDIETFRYRAVGDSVLSVDQMEDARTHYRASLRWMQDISSKLDPEQYKKLEKFRKVQNEVRLSKEKFDRQKWAVCQKVDLLCASRSNLFSNTLVPYQNDSIKFWEKTAHTMAAVLENIKDYQNYEFKLLKGLNPLQASETNVENGEANVKKPITDDDDEQLIDLAAGDDKNGTSEDKLSDEFDGFSLLNKDKEASESLNNLFTDDINGHEDVYHDIKALDLMNDRQPLLVLNQDKKESPPVDDNFLLGNLDEANDYQPSKEDLDLLNNILGNEEKTGEKELEQQWQSVFGDFTQAPAQEQSNSKVQAPATQAAAPAASGFMPSQLLDLMAMDAGNQFNFNQQLSSMPGHQLHQQGPMMGGYQPPTYQSMFGNMPAAGGSGPMNANTNKPMMAQSKKDAGKASNSEWFNLFAELDPLQNPDSLGKKQDGEKKDGGAC